MSIIVLDQTATPTRRAANPAPRLATLSGTRIALLDNGKVNVDRFLDHVERVLRTSHGVRDVVRRRKPNMSAPAPEAMLAEVAACDAVISAVGD